MALQSPVSTAGPFLTNGSQKEFPFSFRVLEEGHVSVYLAGTRLDSRPFTVRLNSTGYGGLVVFADPPTAGQNLIILREVPLTQLTDIQDNTAFHPEVIEGALDKLTMISQQLAEVNSRALVFPPGDARTPDALIAALLQAVRDAQSVVNRLGKLTVDGQGNLLFDGCLVYTECNHECDCDRADPEPETPVTPPAEQPRGHVVAHRYNRRLQLRLFGDMTSEDSDTCTTDSYVLSIGYNWNSTTAEKAYESVRYYGKYASLEGYDEEGCVYDSDPLDCTVPEYQEALPSAMSAAGSDIRNFFGGGFEVQQPSDRPPVDGPWTGFKNYIRREFFGGPTDVELSDIDDELAVYTQTSTDWYSIWDESPCTTGDGFCTVVLTTVVFDWVPDTDYTGPAPSYVTLESSNQALDCYFGREYCLTGRMDINESFYGLTTCQGDNVEVCEFVILRGTLNGDGEFEKQESRVDRTYKFKGVTL